MGDKNRECKCTFGLSLRAETGYLLIATFDIYECTGRSESWNTQNLIVIQALAYAWSNNIAANLMARFMINISELITSLWSDGKFWVGIIVKFKH